MRNDDGVAAGAGIETRPFDRRPEPLRDAAGARLDVARHGRRHPLVAEDDVAVEVAAERARGVLVADEAGERARGGPVVGLLGRRLDVPPHRDGGGGAVDAGLGAERKMRGVEGGDAGRIEPGDGRPELLVEGLRRAEDLALIAVVHRRAWGVAHPDLAEPLGVVGDGGEVERAVDPAAPRLQLVVVGERDGGAGGEAVRVLRADARAEDVGVGREAGVDVEVAEEGLAEEVEARAGLARLGPLPGRRRRAPARRGEQQHRDGRPAHARTL